MIVLFVLLFTVVRVMSFIEKSVARLHEPERLEKLAFDLGRKHYNYNAIPKYFMVGPCHSLLCLLF